MDWLRSTFDWVLLPQAWLAVATLTALELVLGIDNIVFISILVGRLPEERRPSTQRTGILVAAVARLILLFTIAWIVRLKADVFFLFGQGISWRDIILIGGGLFLLYKATTELHTKLEGAGVEHATPAAKAATVAGVLFQILVLDMVFALDSIITAVGMVDEIGVMITAIVVSIALTLALAKPLIAFVERHPTVKVLALSFLLMIGMVLVADGFEFKVPKGYVYGAMGFSLFVEMLNLRLRKKSTAPVKLKEPAL